MKKHTFKANSSMGIFDNYGDFKRKRKEIKAGECFEAFSVVDLVCGYSVFNSDNENVYDSRWMIYIDPKDDTMSFVWNGKSCTLVK